METISRLLETRAGEHGERTFVVCDDREFSYGEVQEKAAHVAGNLASKGVKPGDHVVVLAGNCPEFLYVFLGLGRIGAVIVPVNPLLKPDEIAYIVNDSEAAILIVIPEFTAFLPGLTEHMPNVRQVYVLDAPDHTPAMEETGPANVSVDPFSSLLEPCGTTDAEPAGPGDEAAIIYTSGTTGMPKGVVLTHRNYIANARMLQRVAGMGPEDRFLLVLPLFHVNAQVVSVLAPLMAGGSLILMRKFNPFAILPQIEKHRATLMSAVPTILRVMCRMPKAEQYDVSSIRFFASGAAPLPEQVYLEAQRVLKRPLVAGYGLTEATCASAVADYRDPVKWNSVGSPLPYTSVRIVDENGADVPYGNVGEIVVGGPTVMKGYYKRPGETAEVLRDGWLWTGDLGRFDEDGYLYVVGRVKDMIIRGGQNVYPQQIENVLTQLDGIDECCVVGVEEERWGQEILAVVKRAEGASVTEEDVIEHCRTRLASYKYPRFVRFVDEFPKTATGKIRKNEVAGQFADVARGTTA